MLLVFVNTVNVVHLVFVPYICMELQVSYKLADMKGLDNLLLERNFTPFLGTCSCVVFCSYMKPLMNVWFATSLRRDQFFFRPSIVLMYFRRIFVVMPVKFTVVRAKSPFSLKWLCVLVLFLNNSFVKCSFLIGFHFEECCMTLLKTTARENSLFYVWPKLTETVSKRPVRL